MRVVYMGTPDFAVPTLEKLTEKHEVLAVFTQPDKPKGRGQKLQFTPVKEFALKKNIPVYQPNRLKQDEESIQLLKSLNPDVIVVVAYGQILQKEILDIPRYGCINVHASLLPELRGAAPINWAVIRGYKKTGITTMQMNEGLDTGDMLLKIEVEIIDDETAGELHDKLMLLGGDLLVKTLEGLENDSIKPQKQDESLSSYSPMLTKELGRINWNEDSTIVYDLIRGVTPWPGAYSFYNDKVIKIWKADKGIQGDYLNPGEVLEITKEGIKIACKKGFILIKELQEVGGKRMSVSSYLNGHTINKGEKLV
jgi:methionyl-tRNA formyltransferase